MITDRFAKALHLAIKAHDGQLRKGTTTPYISHPMAVASISLEHGADEDQAIAALLHDAIEDGGAAYGPKIKELFGERVSTIVQGCTDGVPDENGKKENWKQRKEKYLAHLATTHADVLLVSGCDKLHNARAILSDLENIGTKVYDRFNASMEETLWYYSELSKIFSARNSPIARALADTVAKMHKLSLKD
jgi:GTP pyrophosphokinase